MAPLTAKGSLSAAIMTFFLSSTAVQAVTYHVDELVPVSGYAASYAQAINEKGLVVGSSHGVPASLFNGAATQWQAFRPSLLGFAAKGSYSHATAVNAKGVIAGHANDNSARPNAVRFSGGSASFIDSGANNSYVAFAADSGAFIGNYLKGFGSEWVPVLWNADAAKPDRLKRTSLPRYEDPTGALVETWVNDANNLGVVVGQVTAPSLGTRAIAWKNDTARTLVYLPQRVPDAQEYAYGVNEKGVIVGVSYSGAEATPVVWPAAGAAAPRPLALPPAERLGFANKINNVNQVIGAHGVGNTDTDWKPAVWIDEQMFDLNGSLDASGAGWVLQSVDDINDAGQIVGTGLLNGETRGFVLTPAP